MAPSDSTTPQKSSTPEPPVARPPAPPRPPGGPHAVAPGAFRGVSLEGLKAYLLKNFEQTFVLLTLVAGLHEKLTREFETTRRQNEVLQKQQDELNVVNVALKASAENLAFLNQELQRRQEELNHAHVALKDYSENLEVKVRERTEE